MHYLKMLKRANKCIINISKEAVIRRCSVKKVFLKILESSQENTCASVSFLIKLQAKTCNFIKKDSGTGVFL